MTVYCLTDLSVFELIQLAKADPGAALSACRTRAVTTSPVAAFELAPYVAAAVSCLTRSEAVLEWLS